MAKNNNNKPHGPQQAPFPPAGFTLLGQLQLVREDSRFWWAKALDQKTEEQGILFFDEINHGFLEAGEAIGMMAFLLEHGMPDLLEMCKKAFLVEYAHEVGVIRTAWESIEVQKTQQQEEKRAE
jgi:hypothetical protein